MQSWNSSGLGQNPRRLFAPTQHALETRAISVGDGFSLEPVEPSAIMKGGDGPFEPLLFAQQPVNASLYVVEARRIACVADFVIGEKSVNAPCLVWSRGRPENRASMKTMPKVSRRVGIKKPT